MFQKRSNKKLTTEEFILRAKEIHGNKYFYDKSIYINSKEKLIVTCPKHGDWYVMPSKFILGPCTGCSKCFSDSRSNTTENFLIKANELYPNSEFGFDKVQYKSLNDKVKIFCNFCKEYFDVTPKNFLNGTKHKKCSIIKKSNKQKTPYNIFIQKCIETHGTEKYDLSYIKYVNIDFGIDVYCNECREMFNILAFNFLRGHGHKKCSMIKMGEEKKLSPDIWIQRITEKYGDKFDYSETFYNKATEKVKIKCLDCNNHFEQSPNHHEKHGLHPFCPNKQGYSSEELSVVNWLKEFNIELIQSDRNIINPKELDIYIPDKNLAIEYNGLYWHSEIYKEKDYHLDKTLKCKEKGIQLFHIFSDEWLNKQEIIKSMIKYRLKIDQIKEQARKLEFVKLTEKESKEFFNENHISGYVKSNMSFGLKNKEGIILSAISFRKPIQKKYGDKVIEIARFANKLNHNINGGFQKLLINSELILQLEYNVILTYADLRFGTGNVYQKSGFEFKGRTNLDYWYIKNGERENRFKYRAQNGMSEKEYTEFCDVYKIYGCGSNIYIKNI